jgi:ribonuclease P protein component
MDSIHREKRSRSHRFGPERRLRRRSEFQRVFEAGQRTQGRFLTLVVARNSIGRPRLGIVASRRIGNAVRRNRAKRLIREVFRQTDAKFGLDVVVIPRREFFDAAYTSLETDFRTALDRCALRMQRNPPAS